MDWNVDQLAYLARWVIWPLLQPLVQQVGALATRLSSLAAKVDALPQPGPLVAPALAGQQINFSTLTASEGSYIGRDDTAATLADAQLLYRAAGGELLQKFTLSCMALDGFPPDPPLLVTVEIRLTDYHRAHSVAFAPPVVLELSLGQTLADLPLALSLGAGDCLVAAPVTSWAGLRVDGTIVVKGTAS